MSNSEKQKKTGPGPIRVLFVPAELIEPLDKLSRRTVLRCQKALEHWQNDGKYDYLAVAGGLFMPRHIQTQPAGLLMARWFHEHGVDTERLVIEQHSLDTYKNIEGAMAEIRNLLGHQTAKNLEITIVSQWQHAWRFAISFRKMFGLEVKVSAVDYPLGLVEWLKEFAFVFIHYVDPRGVSPVARLNRRLRQQAAMSG